jgi:hypothetical protein
MIELKDFPEQFVKLPIEKQLSDDQMSKVLLGKKPLDMDHRWIIYYNDGFLYFHRSWTGNCIYKIKIDKSNYAAKIVEVLVNTNPKEYKYSNIPEEINHFNQLFDSFLQSKF